MPENATIGTALRHGLAAEPALSLAGQQATQLRLPQGQVLRGILQAVAQSRVVFRVHKAEHTLGIGTHIGGVQLVEAGQRGTGVRHAEMAVGRAVQLEDDARHALGQLLQQVVALLQRRTLRRRSVASVAMPR